MVSEKDKAQARKNLLDRIWDEVKKLNWQRINEMTHSSVHIGLAGTDEETSTMREWLKEIPYKVGKTKRPIQFRDSSFRDCTTNIGSDLRAGLARQLTFCLAAPSRIRDARATGVIAHTFDSDDCAHLPRHILADLSEESRFALAYHFPAFRPAFSDLLIADTAFQNMCWAITTAVPDIVPGPHQGVTAAAELLSDFAVLTANEVKLTFETVGLSGYDVNPLYCTGELAIVLGFAGLAQVIATNIAAKAPAGAGLAFKGGIAYGFTYAIGEAVFWYTTTGEKMGRDFFEERIRKYADIGTELARKIVDNRKKAGTAGQ